MSSGMAEQKDARTAARKVLRCPARLMMGDTVAIKGRTIDISMSGVSIMLDEPVTVGRPCTLVFDPSVNGKLVKISILAKAVYCTCVGTSGFRVGMQFGPQDAAMAKLIRQLLQ
jgi:hypothetical protein